MLLIVIGESLKKIDKITDAFSLDPNVIGKSTAEMQMESTFTDWDFVEIWNNGENQTYPYLRVYPAGDLNHDEVVNLPDFAIFAYHWLAGAE